VCYQIALLSKVTTYEKKNGFLLIEVFRKLVNPKNYGHQGLILGGHSPYAGISRKRQEIPIGAL
jgi:hypothetical protein